MAGSSPRPGLRRRAQEHRCLAKGRHAFLPHHIGDLENYETFRSFTEATGHLARLFDVDPRVVAHDLHPEYLSTKHARELEDVELVGVQHLHAHVASCLADNGESGPVIGVAFDGLGFGTDGTVWGGEVLVADLEGLPARRPPRCGRDAGRDGGDPRALADGGRPISTPPSARNCPVAWTSSPATRSVRRTSSRSPELA